MQLPAGASALRGGDRLRAGWAGLAGLLLVLLGLLGMHGLAGGGAAPAGSHGPGHAAASAPGEPVAAAADASAAAPGALSHGAPGEAPSHQHLVDLCLAVLAGLIALAALLGVPRARTGLLSSAASLTGPPRGGRRPVPDLRVLQVCRT